MANLIEKAKVFQQELDKQVVAGATSGWMEENAGLVKYIGGNEIKIPKISMDGLADYDRDDGYVNGSVSLVYVTKTMTQDRGRTFSLDEMDVDESNFVATAANLMGEFQSTKVIPEIDAYRYSTIAAAAIAANKATGGYTAAAATILTKIKEDIAAITDVAGEIPLIITISGLVAAILENSTELSKQLNTIEFTKGEIKTTVKAIDVHPIIKAPSARMKTAYIFNDGTTSGQTSGGFTPDTGAKDINWIITPRKAPIAVSKTDKIRIFDPQTNQKASAWKIDYRKYHDLWIPDNKLEAIRINVKQALG